MYFRHATGVLLLLISSVAPGLGQDRTGPNRMTYGIAGTVRDDSDQHTMENVRVELKASTGTPINSTFTRDNGEFEFSGIPSGEYIIELAMRDYEPHQERVTIENSMRQGLIIFLRRPAAVMTTNSTGTISAHELSVPRKAHDEYEKGLNLIYSKSDYKGAIVQFQRATKDFPSFYEAYAQEGSAYTFMGETGPAEEAMRKSIEVSSSQYPEAFFLLAGLLNNTKRSAEAEALCRQGLALDASSWQGNFEMARSLLALKRPEEAEKNAMQARAMRTDDPAVYLMLANIHIQLHNYAALLKDLDSYLKLAPTGPEADRARKTRDQVQDGMRSEQVQARAKEHDQSGSETSDQTRSIAPDQASSSPQDKSKPGEPGQSQSDRENPPLLPPLPAPQLEP